MISEALGSAQAQSRRLPTGVSANSFDAGYFHHSRQEIRPLLPPNATCILDVGAGVGATSAWLRTLYPNALTVALEGNPEVIADLSRNCDVAHLVDLNEKLPAIGRPDLIILLDVLEHLADPWQVLRNVTSLLAPGGTVIVSLPNIAHLSVSLPLLLRGNFAYQEAGILDRTHLRFFTRHSALALLNAAGLRVDKGLLTGFNGPRTAFAHLVTAGLLRDHLTKQYILSARRFGTEEYQGPVRWRPIWR